MFSGAVYWNECFFVVYAKWWIILRVKYIINITICYIWKCVKNVFVSLLESCAYHYLVFECLVLLISLCICSLEVINKTNQKKLLQV